MAVVNYSRSSGEGTLYVSRIATYVAGQRCGFDGLRYPNINAVKKGLSPSVICHALN